MDIASTHEECFAFARQLERECDELDHCAVRLAKENAELRAKVESAEWAKECANTPLMRDVLNERDQLRTKLSAASDVIEAQNKALAFERETVLSLRKVVEAAERERDEWKSNASAVAERNEFPDNEADGVVFCGKCGARKGG